MLLFSTPIFGESPSIKQLRKAAEAGNSYSQELLGLVYYTDKDYVKAVNWFRKAVASGNTDAYFNLGQAYSKGEGVTQDYAEAAKWYRKGADTGNRLAQNTLGDLYSKGEGVTQDYAEAAKWYRKGADAGDAEAQFKLGIMYYKGQGLPQDYKLAYMWINLSASMSVPNFTWESHKIRAGARDVVQAKLTQDELDEAERLGTAWRPTVIMPPSIPRLTGVKAIDKPREYAEAVRRYRKAADMGDAKAQFNLGRMYAEGKGVTQDYVLAYMWINLSASTAVGEDQRYAMRDEVASKLTRKQLEEAQRLAREWRPKR